jgi:hypothetical protein
MSPGVKPSLAQLAEERAMTLKSATDELLAWDAYEQRLLDFLERGVADNPTLAAIVRKLQRGNRIEDADHLELADALKAV